MSDPALGPEIRSLITFYRTQVLKRPTRTVKLFGRRCRPSVMYTFLGYELKAGKRRITCPDVATARYLSVFAELGLAKVDVPYDVSLILELVPELERRLQILRHLIQKEGASEKDVYRKIRRGFQR